MKLFDFEKTDAKSTYRIRALQEYGAICAICDYGYEVKMLDVHHIDGDRTNNKLENLEVRCIWCHAVETRGVKWHMWNGQDFSKTGNHKILISEKQYLELQKDKSRLDKLDTISKEKDGTWSILVLDTEVHNKKSIREVLDNLET